MLPDSLLPRFVQDWLLYRTTLPGTRISESLPRVSTYPQGDQVFEVQRSLVQDNDRENFSCRQVRNSPINIYVSSLDTVANVALGNVSVLEKLRTIQKGHRRLIEAASFHPIHQMRQIHDRPFFELLPVEYCSFNGIN